MKNKAYQGGRILPIVLAVVLIGLAVPKLLSYADQPPQAEPRQRPPTAVRVVELTPQPLQDKLVLNGTLSGAESVALKSEVVGRVVEVLFDEGSEVEQGQLLLRLDDSELRAERTLLQTELDLAQENYQRRRRLYGRNLVSEEDYEAALSNRKVLEARIALLDTRLKKTAIKAPFSGVIGLRYVSPGELVIQNTPIANLEIVDRLKLTFSLPEIYQTRLSKNLDAVLKTAGVTRTFTAQVYAWDPRVDAASRSIQVRARVNNPERLLLPGNFVTVTLTLETISGALMIPATALVRGLEQNTVFIVENDKAVAKTVSVGIRTRDQVQITGGLNAGDQVVYRGVQSLRDGQAVTVSAADPFLVSPESLTAL